MSSTASKLAELARINLAFARAEIVESGAQSENIERALCHIGEADAFLGIIAPEFDARRQEPAVEID
jgi:hypothetical protein